MSSVPAATVKVLAEVAESRAEIVDARVGNNSPVSRERAIRFAAHYVAIVEEHDRLAAASDCLHIEIERTPGFGHCVVRCAACHKPAIRTWDRQRQPVITWETDIMRRIKERAA